MVWLPGTGVQSSLKHLVKMCSIECVGWRGGQWTCVREGGESEGREGDTERAGKLLERWKEGLIGGRGSWQLQLEVRFSIDMKWEGKRDRSASWNGSNQLLPLAAEKQDSSQNLHSSSPTFKANPLCSSLNVCNLPASHTRQTAATHRSSEWWGL